MRQLSASVARVPLWLIVALFVALAAWHSVLIPLGEGPDELPHFTVTRYIVQHGHLPDTPEEHEAFQPPLYYLLAAAATFWVDTRDFNVKANADYDPYAPDAPKMLLLHTSAEAFPYRNWVLAWHLMRALSVLMGAGTVAAVYAAARALTGERMLALSAAAAVAFLPSFIYLAAVVNNDNLSTLFAALLIWRIAALLVERRARARDFILMGALLGLGLLSKTSMLAFAATLGLTLLAAARLQRWPIGAWLRANALVFGAALLISGWYFARNYLLYRDLLAWPLVLAANAVRTAPLALSDWLQALVRVYRSFWLEWIGIALEPWMHWLLGLFALLALAGLARSAFALVRAPHARVSLITTLLILGAHCALIFTSWLRWTQTVLGTEQARLFYPALASLIIFLIVGLARWHARLPLLFALVMFGLALVTPLYIIAPTYAPAPRIAALPASAQPISATFKDKLRLIGWQVPETRVRAGEVLHVALYWQALKDLDEDDWLKLQLLDTRDNFLVFKDGSPSAGRDTTDTWRRGEQIAAWHRLVIPANAPRGVYRLALGVHPYGRKNWFPIEEENMWTALGDQLVLTEIVIE